MVKARTSGFRWLPSYYEALRELPDADRLALYDALLDFGFGNEPDELPPTLQGLFILIRPTLEKSVRFMEKQSLNGAKGGRPRKAKHTADEPEAETQNEEPENPDETQPKPTQNPDETQPKPTQNPDETQTDFSENRESESEGESEGEREKGSVRGKTAEPWSAARRPLHRGIKKAGSETDVGERRGCYPHSRAAPGIRTGR